MTNLKACTFKTIPPEFQSTEAHFRFHPYNKYTHSHPVSDFKLKELIQLPVL